MDVIIIDSGIDKNLFREEIIGGVSFKISKNKIVKSNDFADNNGHGSACASIIKSVAKDTKIYAIKILDENANTNVNLLEQALYHCLKLDYRLINLSLATLDSSGAKRLEKLCKKLKRHGKIIVASVYNGYDSSFPACFKSVIGVKVSVMQSPREFWFNKNYEIQCVGNITPCFTNRNLKKYVLFGGNSKAAAHITGYIANLLKKILMLKQKKCLKIKLTKIIGRTSIVR